MVIEAAVAGTAQGLDKTKQSSCNENAEATKFKSCRVHLLPLQLAEVAESTPASEVCQQQFCNGCCDECNAEFVRYVDEVLWTINLHVNQGMKAFV